MKSPSRHRWFVVGVFFAFMLLHQSDKLLIGPLTTPIMETFDINEKQMGAVSTGALLVGAVLYPLWGYLYDRLARPRLLALASLIWGATTWLSAIAPNYRSFLFTRASTGIDDSSYPGLYSLISDYFGPQMRGRVYGLLQVTMPLGYMMGMLLALLLSDSIGWRAIFYITGGLGILLALVIFFTVKDVPRGESEPEMENIDQIGTFHFDWDAARQLFRKKSLLLLFVQGFFGVFPWNAITYWIFRYLETERNYTGDEVMLTMVVAILILAFGYFAGGTVGDYFFKRTPRGRALVSAVAVMLGAILFYFTLNVPLDNFGLFMVMLGATALFIPFAAPNVTSTVFDITLPEVRSTAAAIQYFIESAGAALAPLMVGMIAVNSSLKNAFLIICISTWVVCSIIFGLVALIIPRDIASLREQMRQRAETLSSGEFSGELPT